MARLDEAGITTNIVRIDSDWYELHKDFEIIRKAKTRRTCNRHLINLSNQITPKTNTMDFFQRLTEASPNLDVTLRMMRASKDGKITIHLIPGNYEIKHLELIATPEELDAEFFSIISKPLAVVNGIQTNADEFIAAAEKTVKPKAPETKKETPGPQKQDPPKEVFVCPWKIEAKLVVDGPGRLRLKEGFLVGEGVSDKGEVLVAFGHGQEWVPIKDLKPIEAKEEATPPAAAVAPAPVAGPPAPPPPPPPPAA